MSSPLPRSTPRLLFLKSLIVGTVFERSARFTVWLLESGHRYRHPELWDLYLEERRMKQLLQRVLRTDSCAVDVGCHIGSFLASVIKLAPRGRHVAFEASTIKAN